jgi:DNA polymerase III delta prime subunit
MDFAKALNDVVGQSHIIDYLLSCGNDFPHLLLTGSTGVGKTFLSQQFLKYALRSIPEIEKEKYILKLSSCDDRGISSLRQKLLEFLRANRKYPAKAWVWIDDADSLPVLTQQALRRLMERYETHVRFIFSSCSSQTFIEPIQSRTVIFQLLPINLSENIGIFQTKYAPHIELSNEARDWIIGFCLGNARQFCLILRLLEASIQQEDGIQKVISLQEIQSYVTAPPVTSIRNLCSGILQKDLMKIFQNLHDLMLIGYTIEDILYFIQVVTQVYSFFSPFELIQLNERCSEVHIRLIQRRFGFFETLKVFAGEIQKDEFFPLRITTASCVRLDNGFRF